MQKFYQHGSECINLFIHQLSYHMKRCFCACQRGTILKKITLRNFLNAYVANVNKVVSSCKVFDIKTLCEEYIWQHNKISTFETF